MRKGFTLVEMMISVTLLSIIVIFLYQTLDMAKISNKFYANQLEKIKEQNNIKLLMYEDMINKEANSSVKFDVDRDGNTIFSFKSSNSFHNPFYNHITYFVSRKNNLIRCESKIAFDKNKISDFAETSFIDKVDSNVTKFKVQQHKTQKNNYIVYIEYENKKYSFFTLKSLRWFFENFDINNLLINF